MIGQRISQLRHEKNLTQSQLANELNLSQGAIGMYESGRRNPDVDKLLIFANYFDVSLDFLLGISNVRQRESMSLVVDELRLLEVYRKLPTLSKGRLLERAEVLLEKSCR